MSIAIKNDLHASFNNPYNALIQTTRSDKLMELLGVREVCVLGSGATGDVMMAQGKFSPFGLFAVKKYRFEVLEDVGEDRSLVVAKKASKARCLEIIEVVDEEKRLKYYRTFCKEAKILQYLKHVHIVRHIASYESPKFCAILMEYCSGGALSSHIGKLDLPHIQQYFIQIGCAVRYVHRQSIVHRDIKLDNILVRQVGCVVLTDFGLSENLPNGHRMVVGQCGTDGYMAPELQLADADTVLDGFKADAYAMGVVLWSMMNGKRPSSREMILDILTGNVVFDPVLTNVMFSLLTPDPNHRIDVIDLLFNLKASGWFTGYINSL